jgi:aspartate/methionine/tyrosine aminotransferase
MQRLPRAIGTDAPLVCTLNGFSKMFALPGVKFGWMTVSGDPDRVKKAIRSLELISDTFLPVNEIIQAAAPKIFEAGKGVRDDFAGRIRECWRVAKKHLDASSACRYSAPKGGFYVTIELPDLEEESAAEAILQKNHIMIHPGYFYDMKSNHLILCFVQKPEDLDGFLPEMIGTLDRMTAR